MAEVLAPIRLNLPKEALNAAIDECRTEDDLEAPLSEETRLRIGLFICAYDAAMAKLAAMSDPK